MRLHGLVAAPFTPMNRDGSLNLEQIEPYATRLKADGVKGVFVCGTTGEGYSLELSERKQVLEEWMKFQTSGFKVLCHVGTPSYLQSGELARHAAAAGAYAIGAMGPSFFQPTRSDELVSFCARIAAEAPELPFYYYHLPSMSGVHVSMKEFLEQASRQIPSLQGIKFTHYNLMEMQQCMEFDHGKYEILHGYDEVLLGGLALGIKAAIGSTYNYMAPVYNQIISFFEAGRLEEARSLQRFSVELVEQLFRYRGGIVAGKAIQSLTGIECGPCRIPLQTLTEQEISDLLRDLLRIDFFKRIQA